MKFTIKDFFSKCDLWPHLLNKFLMENFIFFVQWDATYVNKSFVVFKDNSPRMKTWATAQKYSNDYIFCRFYKFPKKHS